MSNDALLVACAAWESAGTRCPRQPRAGRRVGRCRNRNNCPPIQEKPQFGVREAGHSRSRDRFEYCRGRRCRSAAEIDLPPATVGVRRGVAAIFGRHQHSGPRATRRWLWGCRIAPSLLVREHGEMGRGTLCRAALLLLLTGGCASVFEPEPALSDFRDDMAEVTVPFGNLGPLQDRAKEAADPVAADYCRTLGKGAIPMSARRVSLPAPAYAGEFAVRGEYIFLFRCEAADSD